MTRFGIYEIDKPSVSESVIGLMECNARRSSEGDNERGIAENRKNQTKNK